MSTTHPGSTDARLALDGGTPLRDGPFPTWPAFAEDEVDAVSAVLRSGKVNYWTGEQGRAFEDEFAAYCGTRHAVALANGTVALELALRVLGIGPGDEVIVPPKTFIATASAVVMCGARPVFVDVDGQSQCLAANQIVDRISERTRAMIVVHLGGWVCDMPAIAAVARARGLAVIEDCAQAHGATFQGQKVGSFGDVAAFSFCQDKIMSTGGEGGMLLTNKKELWRAAWAFKDHGKSYAAVYEQPEEPDAVYRWLHESFGSNWRMTEMQAAIGRLQLQKLDGWLDIRRRNAAVLEDGLAGQPGLQVAQLPGHIGHARYKFYLAVEQEVLAPGWDRDRILRAINAEGVPCFSGACSEIYRERAFVDGGLAPAAPLPNAHRLGQVSLMLNCHPTLSADDMQQMVDAVRKVMAVAAAG